MNDLILNINGVAVLDGGTISKICEFERKIREAKKAEDELKAAILHEMEQKNVLKIDNDELTISYVGSTYREQFDSKKFKAENPEQYDKYVKIATVKPSVRIKVK